MSTLNTIALVAGPLVGAALAGIIELARERQQTRAAADLADRQTQNETRLRGWDRRAAQRATQADTIRKWMHEQVVADHFAASARITLAFHERTKRTGREPWLQSEETATALRKAIEQHEAKSRTDPAFKVESVISGISDPAIISAVRALALFKNTTIRPTAQRLADSMESDHSDKRTDKLMDKWDEMERQFDAHVAALNRVLEAYCAEEI